MVFFNTICIKTPFIFVILSNSSIEKWAESGLNRSVGSYSLYLG